MRLKIGQDPFLSGLKSPIWSGALFTDLVSGDNADTVASYC